MTLIGPAGLPVTIPIGWDRPLREYFSNVLPEEEDDSDYSAVVLARFDSVSKIAVAFSAAALTLPQAMLDAAELDGMNDAGNVLRWFGPDGAVIQEHRFYPARPHPVAFTLFPPRRGNGADMKRKHEIVERVQRTLTHCGWPPMDGTAIAYRDFSTAVGIKKALVYLAFFGPDAQGVMLQGDYWSEGRNVIPCDLLPRNGSDDVLDAQVRRFAMSAESAVLGSFAARLLHL